MRAVPKSYAKVSGFGNSIRDVSACPSIKSTIADS
jgi:hypothetical protein